MKAGRPATLLLLAGILVLASGGAAAQPHMPPPEWRDPAGPTAEPQELLRRLVGSYRVEGLAQAVSRGDCPTACESIRGRADCIGIGAGPGIHCIFDISWLDLYNVDFQSGSVSVPPGGVSYLNPSMALFGLDSGGSAISYLLVDNKGLPEGGPGAITGSRVVFTTRCVNAPGCQRVVRIEARADASLVYLWIDTQDEVTKEPMVSILLSLRRVPTLQPARKKQP